MVAGSVVKLHSNGSVFADHSNSVAIDCLTDCLVGWLVDREIGVVVMMLCVLCVLPCLVLSCCIVLW